MPSLGLQIPLANLRHAYFGTPDPPFTPLRLPNLGLEIPLTPLRHA